MECGDVANDLAIHFFGPGVINVAAAQTRLDMADFDLAVIGRKRACHGGRGIALHDHPIGFFRVENFANTGQQARGERIERLVGLHDVEVMLGREFCEVQHLIQHIAMLARDADAAVKARVSAERMRQREQFDRLWASAENRQDALRCRHATRHSAKRLTPPLLCSNFAQDDLDLQARRGRRCRVRGCLGCRWLSRCGCCGALFR